MKKYYVISLIVYILGFVLFSVSLVGDLISEPGEVFGRDAPLNVFVSFAIPSILGYLIGKE
jgi:hypothetical protein